MAETVEDGDIHLGDMQFGDMTVDGDILLADNRLGDMTVNGDLVDRRLGDMTVDGEDDGVLLSTFEDIIAGNVDGGTTRFVL